jgi:hypothetical protein
MANPTTIATTIPTMLTLNQLMQAMLQTLNNMQPN